VGAIRPLHLAIVPNPHRFETEVGREAVRAHRDPFARDRRAESVNDFETPMGSI
jgi:hypothetical protein